ncbi:MAG: CBS domain-containing protein [Candidatus Binatia bacterium]
MKVKDLMQTNVAVLRDSDTLDAAEELMAVGWIRHLPVVDADSQLLGMVTQRDVFKASLSSVSRASENEQQHWLSSVRVQDVMTKEVKTVDPEAELSEAVGILLENKFGALPVVTEKQLIGMLTETDMLHHLQQLLEKERRPQASGRTKTKQKPKA